MTNAAQSQKLSLECLRLESACKELAGRVRDPVLKSHFIEMALVWNDRAYQGLGELAVLGTAAVKKCAV